MAISVEDALRLIREDAVPLGNEVVSLEHLAGRVLAEDLAADRPFPPYDRIMMDGVALNADAFEAGQRIFPVQEFQPAGMSPVTLQSPDHCIEIATGASLPVGCNAVVMYEQLNIKDDAAHILCDDIKHGQHIHPQGSDRKQGDIIVPRGGICGAAEIGVAATVGKSTVTVVRQPRIVFVTTGDELVDVDITPAPHQIRKSNAYALGALFGFPTSVSHLPDDRGKLSQFFEAASTDFDVIVLCGAVSKGKRDFVPEVLSELGATQVFHGVHQRPGKPMWFGRLGDTRIFGLPGNPVSTFLCGLRYLHAWIGRAQGIPPSVQTARLAEAVTFEPALTYFLQVKLQDGKAIPVPGRGSGDHANLVDADGFLELPADRNHFTIGERFPVHPYRRQSL